MHAWALGLTIGLEGAALGLFLAVSRATHRQIVLGLFLAVGLNLLTHTLFWYSFPWLPLAYGPRLWLCEALIALTEGAVYQRSLALAWPRALGLGISLNLLSTLAGVLLWQRLLG